MTADVTASTVRAARPDDVEAIADAHVRGWLATYRGLVPDAILDALSIDRRTAYWRDTIAAETATSAPPARTWVVETAGAVRGFASTGPIRDQPGGLPNAGEVFAIFPTPGYPDHPSGYNCFTGGLMHAAKAFFGSDEASFSITSPGTNPPTTTTTRQYTRFTDVCLDAIEGRMLIGLHFRTPDVQASLIGKNVAEWVASHYFRRVH